MHNYYCKYVIQLIDMTIKALDFSLDSVPADNRQKHGITNIEKSNGGLVIHLLLFHTLHTSFEKFSDTLLLQFV